MKILADCMVVLVALLHIYFLILEMFFWDKPYGMRIFGLKQDFAKASKTLAANQGLYNGFLAAGLLWGQYLGDRGYEIKLFFLVFILIAGIFGSITANRRILFIQALPALIAMILLYLLRYAE